jgi:hypothetical protein
MFSLTKMARKLYLILVKDFFFFVYLGTPRCLNEYRLKENTVIFKRRILIIDM